MERKELLPYPFCGGEAKIDWEFTGISVVYGIHCYNCKIGYSDYIFDSKDEAIEAWNRRTEI